jgi:phosphatidylinositol glycan class B
MLSSISIARARTIVGEFIHRLEVRRSSEEEASRAQSAVPAWSAPERKHFRLCLAASAFLFFVYAIFSTGHLHPDEYFQTIEFASSKLGITDPAELPWEYGEQMRSWLQPALYVVVGEAAEALGLRRPMVLILVFRLVTGLLAWSALWTLIIAGRRWIDSEEQRRRLYSIAALLWLLPLLGVRTSGETAASAALCFAIAALEWRADLQDRMLRFLAAVLGGLAFGLCFELRYPSGVMAAGAGLWYLYSTRQRLSLFVSLFMGLALGATLALALGVIIDRWGYGTTTFPAYSYLYQNLVEGKAASGFGASPFFAYLYLPLENLMAPVALVLMVATLTAWIRRPFSALTWASAPYVVVLCILSHKEARFLYSLAPFLPFFVVFALAPGPSDRLASAFQWMTSGRRLRLITVWNACGLLGVLFISLRPEFTLYQLLETRSFATQGVLDVAVAQPPDRKPYWYLGLHHAFIEPKNLRLTPVSVAELEAKRARGETFLAIVHSPRRVPEPAAWLRSNCTRLWSPWPVWLERFNFFRWQERTTWLELYSC